MLSDYNLQNEEKTCLAMASGIPSMAMTGIIAEVIGAVAMDTRWALAFINFC